MRALLLAATLLGCGDPSGSAAVVDEPDAAAQASPPDAAPPGDSSGVEDLDMTVADFVAAEPLMMATPRGYRVANLLGHEDAALAAASSGGAFPVGSVVALIRSEAMVKRRNGWNAPTNDWEFFRLKLGSDGKPSAIDVRGREETSCFACHQMVSSPAWDFICDHP